MPAGGVGWAFDSAGIPHDGIGIVAKREDVILKPVQGAERASHIKGFSEGDATRLLSTILFRETSIPAAYQRNSRGEIPLQLIGKEMHQWLYWKLQGERITIMSGLLCGEKLENLMRHIFQAIRRTYLQFQHKMYSSFDMRRKK